MMQFYKFLYAELLWNEEIKSPIDNNDTKVLLLNIMPVKAISELLRLKRKMILIFASTLDISSRTVLLHIMQRTNKGKLYNRLDLL